MSMAGGFLGGAHDRLLPASIPFRFFLSAAGFQVLAWAVLLVAAGEVPGFRGGTGPVLAAIHLLTLGVLAMTAIGASLQLFPVVTRRALTRHWPGHLVFALMLVGVSLLCWGMGAHRIAAMQLGAALTGTGLAGFALVTAGNLRGASAIPAVAAHGWLAMASLLVVAGLGVLLVWDFADGFLAGHGAIATLHLVLAIFGFMGLLAFGLSLVLIPMFALSRSLPKGPDWGQLALVALALVLVAASNLPGASWLFWPALAAGLGAAGLHLWLMATTMKRRMRKRLGLSFRLIRASWGLLVLGLLLIAAWGAGAPIPNAPALIVFVLLAGWLLTFLCGVLQRILPFLASMHAAGKSGLPPLLSDLAGEGPLNLHASCHFPALVLCAAGILLDQPMLIRLGAALGVVGAAGFAVFALRIAAKLRRTVPAG